MFSDKAKKRNNASNQWKQTIQTFSFDRPIWIHAASVGEFEQARPVIELLKQEYPHKQILITFFSPSAYELRKNYPHADCISYLPLDTPNNAQQFVKATNPCLVLWVKYDIWYNHLKALQQRQIPILLFSAIFRPNQIYFKPYGRFMQKALHTFEYIFVQNKSSLDLLKSIGIQNTKIAGDTRFDRVFANAKKPKEIPSITLFKGDKENQELFVIGSSWKADLKILIPFIKHTEQNQLNIKFVIAPHEIKQKEIDWIKKELGTIKNICYSDLNNSKNVTSSLASAKVYILDTIGLLSATYQYADFAYIGGGFGTGIHNILEAAVFGVPIFFGPKYHKFQEALDLTEQKLAFPITSLEELKTAFEEAINNNTNISTGLSQYIDDNIGGTNIVIKYIHSIEQRWNKNP